MAFQTEIKVDELHTRLTELAAKQDNSPNSELSRSPPPESTRITPPPTSHPFELQISSFHRLVEDGCRPVCSIQELLHILDEPQTSYKAVLSWLSDDPDSDDFLGGIKTVFSTQFDRWWNFRKSQWENRGLEDSEGVSAYLKACRRQYEVIDDFKATISAPSFDETNRRLWQFMAPSRQLPSGQAFSAYGDAVQIRLASHRFARPLHLKENPQQQSAWTNWLEYLNYEQWHLERLNAAVESRALRYDQSWKRLLTATEWDSNHAPKSSVTSGSLPTRQGCPGAETDNRGKELRAAQADRDALKKMVDDFVRETTPYTHFQRAACYQRHRVEWIVREAHLMENEMSQSSKMAKNDTKVDTDESKKRRCDDHDDDDDEEITPESQSKRAK